MDLKLMQSWRRQGAPGATGATGVLVGVFIFLLMLCCSLSIAAEKQQETVGQVRMDLFGKIVDAHGRGVGAAHIQVMLDGTPLPHLPPSVARVLSRPRNRGSVVTLPRQVLLEEAIDTDSSIGGGGRIQLQVRQP